ncbi:leucyl/phenylalanyl-tRNA--protein transferase [Rhodoferax aquaticus]|nr:leucyl/phenylalanyl-tRNA--protein transferase [Rhodoferax aquaticus]
MAWPADSDAPGLLAAGGALDVPTLLEAYRNAVFPWFGEGQPILWWSPDPRMVLKTSDFRVHRSMRKTLVQFTQNPSAGIRMNTAFARVIESCAQSKRKDQFGTWIMPRMVDAYTQLHAAGYAHSVETWINGELVGGLYCVNIGMALFGESMFAHQTNASKIALAALVAWAGANGIEMIDCQQNTNHLTSLGASEIPRSVFAGHVSVATNQPGPSWTFNPLYWDTILQR